MRGAKLTPSGRMLHMQPVPYIHLQLDKDFEQILFTQDIRHCRYTGVINNTNEG